MKVAEGKKRVLHVPGLVVSEGVGASYDGRPLIMVASLLEQVAM